MQESVYGFPAFGPFPCLLTGFGCFAAGAPHPLSIGVTMIASVAFPEIPIVINTKALLPLS